MKTASGGADPTPQAEKNSEISGNISDVSNQIVNAANSDAQPAVPQATTAAAPPVEDALPTLSPEDREKFYERLRNNVPETLQKEHRWVLLYDTGKKRKMPIGGHPSATMNLEQAIDAHRKYKGRGNNALAIGYSTGGKSKVTGQILPPDPHCIWLDYDDLKDADGKTIAAPKIIEEIENLREYGAYVEISMSGKGMHVCIPKPRYYDALCKGIIRDSHQPEVFGNGQYVAVTGRLYGDRLPDWTAFATNPFAAKVVRSIITREGGWKKREPDIYDTQEGADNRVIETWQKIDPKPTGVEAAVKIAEIIADVDFGCDFQYLCPETIRRLWSAADQFRDADVDTAVTAALDAAVAWRERYREEVRKQREDERRQTEARLRTEFHVSAENVPDITFNGADADWNGKIAAVNYIDGFCTRNIPVKKITDPSKTAYRICTTTSEYLAKHDPEHCTPDCINAVFMDCKLFPYLYGPDGMHRKKYPDGEDDGWNPRKAGLCIANIWRKREEQKQDIQNQIAAQKRAADAELAAEMQAWADHDADPERVYPTLSDVARYIASVYSHFIGTYEYKDEHILDENGNPLKKIETYFNIAQFRREWHWATHLVAIGESKTGFFWFNGTWEEDPCSRGIYGAIEQAAELIAENVCDKWAEARSTLVKTVSRNAAAEDVRTLCISKLKPQAIAALRHEATVSLKEGYAKGLTCTDGVIVIDAASIHKKVHDPDRDVWFGSVPVSVDDLLPNIESMTFDEVVNHFPHARESLEACGAGKVRLMASMAGVAVYYTQPNHIPLDVWYYLWDAVEGGTGKSTHMRLYRGCFGKYIAFGIGWEVFTGENEQNGEFLGKIGVECEEAGVNDIKSVEKLKARTSGGWELKMLYQNPVGMQQPLLMISLGNVKPLLSRVANTRPIWERLQPCEFTEKLRNTGKEFPCSDDEYYKFLLNIGCWVAYKLMQKGKAVCKRDLPYYIEPEEVEALCTRVPWIDILPDIGGWESGKQSPLNTVYECIKAELKRQGWTDADMKGAPELRNLATFRRAIDGVTMPKRNDSGYPAGKGLLKVVGVGGELRKQSRHWIKNFQLTADVTTTGSTPPENALTWETPQPASASDAGDILRIRGEYIIYKKTGKLVGLKTPDGKDKGWNIEKYLEQDDPLPDTQACERFGLQIYKPAVFHIRLEAGRQTLVNITAT